MNAERDAALVIERARVDYCLSWEIAGKLRDADLLVTDLHKRALEACEEYARWQDGDESREGSAIHQCRTVGRESLAARKPKPRWRVVGWPEQGTVYHVTDREAGSIVAVTGAVAWFRSEDDANADCARRNKLDAEAR
jgi:hypothetical protein